MKATDIQKYQKKSIPDLIKIATKHFNKFIRERDKKLGCISCPGPVENAGHYYSAGQFPSLRFDEKNVHGQCVACNKWRHGNLIEYNKGLIKRYGQARLNVLDMAVDEYRKSGWKWDRIYLIDIIIKYKQ